MRTLICAALCACMCVCVAGFTLARTVEALSHLRADAVSKFESETHVHAFVEEELARLLDDAHGARHAFLVSVSQDFDIDRLRRLDGAHSLSIVSQSHYQVWARPAEIKALMVSPSVLAVLPVIPAMKLDRHMQSLQCYRATKPTELAVEVAALSASERDVFLDWLHAASVEGAFAVIGTIVPERQMHLKVVAACTHAVAVAEILAKSSEVLWIEEFRPVRTCNYWSRGVMESGVFYDLPIRERAGLTGAGQIIGIADTGLDMTSTYFFDNVTVVVNAAKPNLLHRKVVSYTSSSASVFHGDSYDSTEAHGTHVVGIAAGKAYKNYGDFKRFNGVAYDAKIAFFDIERNASGISLPVNIDSDLLQVMFDMGAKVFTNSWGDSSAVAYDGKALQVDKFMVEHPDVLVLFAAGNTGDAKQNADTKNNESPVSSVNSPAILKNGLAVGASLNDHQSWLAYTYGTANNNFDPSSLAKFSSRGPTRDGRIKPEIVAPGIWVTSAQGLKESQSFHTGVSGKAGTSMASPGAAGMAAVIRQYFMEGYYFSSPQTSKNTRNAFTPSGALLKAMLIASCTKLFHVFASYDGGNTYTLGELIEYPSNDQGYGRIQLNSVLNFGPSSLDPLTLFVVGDTNEQSPMYRSLGVTGELHTYVFKVATNQPVRVVMAYTDAVGSTSSTNVIINDLQLSVAYPGTILFPFSGQDRNTFKVIDINATPDVVYTVSVFVKSINSATNQTYSLVIVGPVAKLAPTTENTEIFGSSINADEIPFIPAIIGMSCISFLILVVVFLILAANRCPSMFNCFKRGLVAPIRTV